MQYTNYYELYKETGKFEGKEALILLEKVLENFPESEYKKHLPDIMHRKAMYYCRCEMYEECIDIAIDMVEQGFVCGPWLLRMLPLKEDERYIKLKEKNDILLAQAQEKAKLEYVVNLPEGYTEEKQYPLFLAFHGGGENIDEFSDNWKPDAFVKNGFITVYVQSSQVSWHNHYNWNNTPVFRNDIKTCYDLVTKEYSVDKECVIIGGFCGGAMPTVDITMTNVIPVKGFIALCAYVVESFTKENAQAAANRGVKGVFMEGENDESTPEVEEMTKVFDEVGLPYQHYINKGTGHWYPDDLSDKLEKALKFILD